MILGEVVFSTNMVGYPESMTDPSFSGQILNFTFPLVGNYGVPPKEVDEHGLMKYFESDKIHCSGIVVSDYAFDPSHWNSAMSLSDWLKAEKIPGIYGVDTRAITRRIRETGAMKGKIVVGDKDVPYVDINNQNLVANVTTP